MDNKEFEVEYIKRCNRGMMVSCPGWRFIKITHLESGITVTKGGNIGMKAKEKAEEEIQDLVYDWIMYS